MCLIFLQASYGSLVKPNLPNNRPLTCDSLMRITGQGAVYIRTMQQNFLESELEDSEDELDAGQSSGEEQSRGRGTSREEPSPLQVDTAMQCGPKREDPSEFQVQPDRSGILQTDMEGTIQYSHISYHI